MYVVVRHLMVPLVQTHGSVVINVGTIVQEQSHLHVHQVTIKEVVHLISVKQVVLQVIAVQVACSVDQSQLALDIIAALDMNEMAPQL